MSRIPRLSLLIILAAIIVLGSMAVASAQDGPPPQGPMPEAIATMVNIDGVEIGVVEFAPTPDGFVMVTARFMAGALEPGFHGFHLHGIGSCDEDFTAAGGHWNPDGVAHGEHPGDLPTLLVGQDGGAFIAVGTDRFSLEDLFDDDGTAVMIHAGSDNLANIPERYGGPDDDTLGAGDGGARASCGVVEPHEMME